MKYNLLKTCICGKTFYIKFENSTKSCNLLLVERNKAFKGSVDESVLENYAKHFKKSKDEYCQSVVSFLVNVPSDVVIKFNEKVIEIKRAVGKQGLQENYFTCKVEETDILDSTNELFDNFIQSRNDDQKQIDALDKKVKSFQNENNILLKKLQEFTEEHKFSERQLISSFLLLLNEKKRRIQFLTDLLDSKAIPREQRHEALSDSQSEEEAIRYSTDEDENVLDKVKSSTSNKSQGCSADLFASDNSDVDQEIAIPKRAKYDKSLESRTVKIESNSSETLNEISSSSKAVCDKDSAAAEVQSSALNFNTQDLLNLV